MLDVCDGAKWEVENLVNVIWQEKGFIYRQGCCGGNLANKAKAPELSALPIIERTWTHSDNQK
jgi:hypothetical protein